MSFRSWRLKDGRYDLSKQAAFYTGCYDCKSQQKLLVFGGQVYKIRLAEKARMKQMSIWQRLNTALFLLVLLLMIGCGLALYIEVAVAKAERRAQELANKKDRISLDLLLMSDSIRGLLLDPRNEADKKHRPETEKDLKTSFEFIKAAYKNQSSLLGSVENLAGYVQNKLLPLHQKVMDM